MDGFTSIYYVTCGCIECISVQTGRSILLKVLTSASVITAALQQTDTHTKQQPYISFSLLIFLWTKTAHTKKLCKQAGCAVSGIQIHRGRKIYFKGKKIHTQNLVVLAVFRVQAGVEYI